MEHRHQQADIPELVQDEDVCCPGSHPHAVWSLAQSLQPPVRFSHPHLYFYTSFCIAFSFNFVDNCHGDKVIVCGSRQVFQEATEYLLGIHSRDCLHVQSVWLPSHSDLL